MVQHHRAKDRVIHTALPKIPAMASLPPAHFRRASPALTGAHGHITTKDTRAEAALAEKRAIASLLRPAKLKRHITKDTTAPVPASAPAKRARFEPPPKADAALRRATPPIHSAEKWTHLREFNKKWTGDADHDVTAAALGELFLHHLHTCNDVLREEPAWRRDLPSRSDLYKTTFGKQSIHHSFAQEASFETTLLHPLCSGFLTPTDTLNLFVAHPLIPHLATAKVAYHDYDFTWIRQYNTAWDDQQDIDPVRQRAMTACLLHYNLDTSLLMHYLGNNYTGAYRETDKVVHRLRHLKIDEVLIDKYVRVMVTGCPNHFVAETSRENALLHWRLRNGPTIDRKLSQVNKTMNKEDKNNFVIPLPHWMARYIPNLFFTPQHILEKPGKKDRQIFDASKRYTPLSTPINMMTSTPRGTEERCTFGRVRTDIYRRMYNLRISYPDHDLVVHANDVKSAFRQIKLHPDIMGAFSYIIGDRLFLSCGLPFGTDFSPANWEVVRQLLEAVAERLFADSSLRTKHAAYLSQLNFDRSLGKTQKIPFTRAAPDGFNHGVRDAAGVDAPTPHFYYVDDGVYIELWDKAHVEQAVASSIEAIFLLLGDSDLKLRQDPISFDKMMEMLVAPINRVLGSILNTHRLTVGTPDDFLREVEKLLQTTWGPHRFTFTIKEAEELAGKLGHISVAAPWLRYLMTHIYSSLARSLGITRYDLIRSSKTFREALNKIRAAPTTTEGLRTKSFYQAETARAVHKGVRKFGINKLLRQELALILSVLTSPSISRECPVAHLIDRTPLAHGYSDSSLRAVGGYCATLHFWWYHEWPEEIRLRTLLHLKNNNSGNFVDINVLEYAGLLVTFLGCCHCIHQSNALEHDPHPMVLISGDNTVSESWSKKASKHSPVGRALGRLQCGLMVNNPIGFLADHISTTENVVADKISRIEREDQLLSHFPLVVQAHPVLTGCQRFVPSCAVISCITEAILRHECPNPVSLSRLMLTAPGKITTWPGATP